MNRYEDDIRERLFVEVYNAEKKRELLKEIPHELRENLAVVYRLSGYDEDTGRDCELVTNEQMKRWGVDAEKLKKDAWENTMAKRPPIFVELEDGCNLRFDRNLLEDDTPVPKGLFPELDMFILTNKMGDNGAIYLLDDKTMQRVSEKIGGNLIAMPSSIHESILYAEETGVDALRAREIVHGANSLLNEELFLSDEVYRYDKDAHTLSIIPELTEDMMPDRISIQEMHAYGYLWEGMLPLTRERALELMDCGLPIYHLAKDNTEGMVENMADFFAYDELFGVEKETWMSYLESQEHTQAESMVPKMD